MKPLDTQIKSTPDLNLTPKAKAEFEQWFKPKFLYGLNSFLNWPFAMQQGVYLEFLRGKGIEAMAQPDMNYPTVWYYPVIKASQSLYDVDSESEPTFHTALIAAIEAGFARIETELLR